MLPWLGSSAEGLLLSACTASKREPGSGGSSSIRSGQTLGADDVPPVVAFAAAAHERTA